MNAPPTSVSREAARCLGIALLIVLVHLAVLLLGPLGGGSFLERYHRLVQLDSYWFLNIIERNYQSPVPPSPVKMYEVSNTAFFPGFPLLGALFIHGFGFQPKTGLTLAAQVAALGFWTYFLLLAGRLGFSRLGAIGLVALVAAHPAAFYLIAAFSESLFLFFVLGYLFWSARSGPGAFAWTAVHGFGMTFTRIAGAPVAFLPVLMRWIERVRGRIDLGWLGPLRSAAVGRGFILAGIALLGMVSFFIYCHVRWGHWNFYMMTQEAGWGVRADYFALFKPAAYARWYPKWDHASTLGQFFVPATVVFSLAVAAWELGALRRGPTRWRERLPLYFVGWALFAISVAGVFAVNLESMTRYHLCSHVFFVLGVAHAWKEIGPRSVGARRILVAATIATALLGAWIQLHFASQFARGEWVA